MTSSSNDYRTQNTVLRCLAAVLLMALVAVSFNAFSGPREVKTQPASDADNGLLAVQNRNRELTDKVADVRLQYNRLLTRSLWDLLNRAWAGEDFAGFDEYRLRLEEHLASRKTRQAEHDQRLLTALSTLIAGLSEEDRATIAWGKRHEIRGFKQLELEQPASALSELTRAIETYENVLGPNNLLSALAKPTRLTLQIRHAGEPQALGQADQIAADLQRTLGEDHDRVLDLLPVKAAFHDVKGQAAKQAALLDLFISQSEKVLDPADIRIPKALIRRAKAAFFAGADKREITGFLDRAEQLVRQYQQDNPGELGRIAVRRIETNYGFGRYEDAIDVAKTAIRDLAQAIETPAQVRLGEQLSYRRILGQIHYHCAVAISYSPRDNEAVAELGEVEAKKKKWQDCRNHLVEAARILDELDLWKTEDGFWLAEMLSINARWVTNHPDLSTHFDFAEQNRAALEQIEKSLSIYREITKRDSPGCHLNSLLHSYGNALRVERKYEDARNTYREGLQLVPEGMHGAAKAHVILRDIAVTYSLEGRKEDAFNHMMQAYQFCSPVFFPGLVKDDASFAHSHSRPLRSLLRDLVIMIDSEDANHVGNTLELISSTKGIISRAMAARTRLSDQEVAKKQFGRLSTISGALPEFYVALAKGNKLTPEQETRKRELELEKQELLLQIGRNVPESRFRFQTDVIARLPTYLNEDTAIIEFYFQDTTSFASQSGYHAFVVRKELDDLKLDVVHLGSAKKIDDLVNKIYASRSPGAGSSVVRGGDYDRADDAEIESALAQLKETVWTPLLEAIGDCRTIVACGDRKLNSVRWAELPGKKPKTHLGSEFTFAYHTNIRDLLDTWDRSQSSSPTKHQWAFVGDLDYGKATAPARESLGILFSPLPAGKSERSMLERLSSQPVFALTGSKAQKETVKDAFRKAKRIYISSHAEQLATAEKQKANQNPLARCYVVLSSVNSDPSPIENCLLTGEEIITMDLSHVEFAVLAACKTAAGRELGGEPALGLQQAMLISGIRSSLASAWPVRDSDAVKFMTLFMTHYEQHGMSRAAAIQAAQMTMAQEGFHRDSWANWTLMGTDPR